MPAVRPIRGIVAALLLALACVSPARASELSAVLREVEALRTVDPVAVDALLAQAALLEARATPDERARLALARAHRATLRGDYTGGLRLARSVADGSAAVAIRYRAALLVSNIAAAGSEYSIALSYLTRARRLETQVADPTLRDNGDVVAATVYSLLGHPKEARRFTERLLAREIPPRIRCLASEGQARAAAAMDEPVDEQRTFVAPADACRAIGETLAANLIATSHAKVLTRTGRLAEARALLERTLPSSRRTGYWRLIGESLGQLAQVYALTGDAAAADAAAREVIQLPGQDINWAPVAEAHSVLSKLAEQRGDHAAALRHYRLYAIGERGRLDEIKARELAFQAARANWAERARTTEILQHQNTILRLRQRTWQQEAWTLRLAVLLLILLAVGGAYWAWHTRRTHSVLRRLGEADPLTGLDNRRAFRHKADRLLQSAAAKQTVVSLLVIDLDHFKRINDQCSHAVGDWVLREAARALLSCARDGDLVGRIGGEEFALLHVEHEDCLALSFAERCRAAIASIDGLEGGCYLPITASVGVTCTRRAGYHFERLFADADAAMYAAKHAGRDRVCLAPDDGSDTAMRACA